MNNLLSYCGLVDAGIIASEKDLPVKKLPQSTVIQLKMKSLEQQTSFEFRLEEIRKQ